MRVRLVFFGALSDMLQKRSEALELPPGCTRLVDLRRVLIARGGHWTKLAEKTILSAVNQQIVSDDCALKQGDEIAFFPPVTGG